MSDFKNGDKVSFRPSPLSKSDTLGTVTNDVKDRGRIAITGDADGKVRKVFPAAVAYR